VLGSSHAHACKLLAAEPQQMPAIRALQQAVAHAATSAKTKTLADSFGDVQNMDKGLLLFLGGAAIGLLLIIRNIGLMCKAAFPDDDKPKAIPALPVPVDPKLAHSQLAHSPISRKPSKQRLSEYKSKDMEGGAVPLVINDNAQELQEDSRHGFGDDDDEPPQRQRGRAPSAAGSRGAAKKKGKR